MKNTLDKLTADELIQKDRSVNWKTEQWKSPNQNSKLINLKRILKRQDSLRNLWDNFKHTNIHIIWVPAGEERQKGTENLYEEIMAEIFPNLKKETDVQVQEAESQIR